MRTLLVALAILAVAGAGFASDASWMGQSPHGAYWTNSVATSGYAASQANWFSATGSTWVPLSGSNSDETPLSVDAYIELYCARTQQTQATFHWGVAPFAAQTASVTGTIVENHPCWIGVSKKSNWTLAEASNLAFDEAGSYAPARTNGTPGVPTGDSTANIPITWKLKVGSAAPSAMLWDTGLNQGNPGWYSDGRMPVGTNSYEIQITATPTAYQADGHYTLDPDVVVLPDM